MSKSFNKLRFLLATAILLFPLGVSAQYLTLKTNLLYGATTTPNLGLEIGLGQKTTLDVSGGYNPFTFSNNTKFKHWLVQPEFRYWLCERFNGSFFGLHLHGGEYNIGGLNLPFGMWPELENFRYQGYFYGAGISYGYQWVLGNRWSLEATAGLGYARFHYDKYECPRCGDFIKTGDKDYFGPTKLGVTLIFVIR